MVLCFSAPELDNYDLVFWGMPDFGAMLNVPFLLAAEELSVIIWFRTSSVKTDTVIFYLEG